MVPRYRALAGALLAAAALWVSGCGARGQPSPIALAQLDPNRLLSRIVHDKSDDPVRSSRYTIEASGTVEAVDFAVLAELGGRVAEVAVGEGEAVHRGQVLVRLDDSDLAAQISQAQAGLKVAQAELGRARAGARPQEIAVARSALQQAQTQARGAWQQWQNAISARDNPQALQIRITEAHTAVALAERDVEMAEAELEAAQQSRDREEWGSAEYRIEAQRVTAAEEARLAAQATLAGAQAKLNALIAIRERPLVLEARMHAAEAAYRIAEASVGVAQAELAAVEAPPLAEDTAIAQATVRQSEAALYVLEVMRDKLLLRAPCDGVVASRAVETGEVAVPGAPLLTVANLAQVNVIVYVPEAEIGRVMLNQQAAVMVDAYPAQPFVGHVTHIADQAEFTPRNVQTKEERVHTVLAVKITVPNPEQHLKPGMPADALL